MKKLFAILLVALLVAGCFAGCQSADSGSDLAYVKKNGKKTYIAKSPVMHAFTKGWNGKYTNAKKVKVKKSQK